MSIWSLTGRWDLAFGMGALGVYFAAMMFPAVPELSLQGLAAPFLLGLGGLSLGLALVLALGALMAVLRDGGVPREQSLSRALIVDDNASHRLVLGHQLTALGVQVSMARNGVECLEALATGDFDVVFLDWMMPVMGGATTIGRLREQEREGSARRQLVVAVTGNQAPGDRRSILDTGVDDYVAKPASPEELNGLLDRFFPGWKPRFTGGVSREQQALGAAEPVMDAGVLRELIILGGSEVLLEVLAGLQEDIEPALQALARAIEQGEPEKVQRSAHKISGAAGAVGAFPLTRLARELERVGESGQLSGSEALLEAVEVEWAKVLASCRAQAHATED